MKHLGARRINRLHDRPLSDHKDRKREYSAASLERVPPSQEEAALLHERFLQDSKALQNGKSHEEVVPISETFMASNLHM